MNIVVFAPHPDDEVLGVGGTIAKRTEEGHNVYVFICTKAETPPFDSEMVCTGRKEAVLASCLLGVKDIFFVDFPALSIDKMPVYQVNQNIERIIREIRPEEIYIPHNGDIHIDHKLVAQAAMVASRPTPGCSIKRIYAYETISETGWDIPNVHNTFIPTVFEDIGCTADIKIKALAIYKSQVKTFPHARSIEAVRALMAFRGAVVGVEAAEAFSLIREVR